MVLEVGHKVGDHIIPFGEEEWIKKSKIVVCGRGKYSVRKLVTLPSVRLLCLKYLKENYIQ